MVLNAKKTCIFIVNFTKNHQFKPLLKIPGENNYLEVTKETKLLGYWLTSDMKPHRHVKYMISIANKRVWSISKLKKAGVSDADLIYFFFMKIRSVLETAVPVFNSMLTKRHDSYEDSLIHLSLEKLSYRRENICLDFALSCLNSHKFKHIFTPTPDLSKFIEPKCDTERYKWGFSLLIFLGCYA